MAAIRVGIVDSGLTAPAVGAPATGAPGIGTASSHAAHACLSAGFRLAAHGNVGSAVLPVAAQPDRLGHGSRVAEVILACAPDARLLVAQVFFERLTTTAAQVAAAIDWLVAAQAKVINLSLGLHEARPVLAAACQRALAAGVILCAATPARGAAVYPAAHDGVLRVTGDARCARHEFAALRAPHADFGAHVRPLDGSLDGAGASIACAHLTGHLAHHLAGRPASARLPAAALAWLDAAAHYRGIERRPKRCPEHRPDPQTEGHPDRRSDRR